MDYIGTIFLMVCVIMVFIKVFTSSNRPRQRREFDFAQSNHQAFRSEFTKTTLGNRGIHFSDYSSSEIPGNNLGSASDYSGLVDALTGCPIDNRRTLYKCKECGVFYHAGSYEYIRANNASICVSCGSTGFEVVQGN